MDWLQFPQFPAQNTSSGIFLLSICSLNLSGYTGKRIAQGYNKDGVRRTPVILPHIRFFRLLGGCDRSLEYGTLLGKALFQEDIRDAFIEAISSRTDNSPVRVLLSIEADDLKFIYWHWLCVPLSLYIPSNADRRFPPIGRRNLRALIFVANPENLESSYSLHPFDAAETVASIQTALGDIPSDVLAMTSGAVGEPTLDQLCGQLTQQSYTLLHIVCHGQFRDQETWLYWSGDNNQVEPVAGTTLIQRLNRLGEQRGLPHFIFLSACESAVPEAEQTDAALGGLGQRLVRELGIPAVIAMTQKITIKTAGLLSAGFYQRLYEHGEIDLSLVEATATLAERFDILYPALFNRLGGQPLFSETLDRDPTNLEIDQGLSSLEKILPKQAPILQDKFNQLQNILKKTLNTNPEVLSHEAKKERQNALQELNTLCTEAIEISFNALALSESPPEYDARCPFKGLYPFRAEDQEFFFGREDLIQQLQKRLEHNNFLAVLGMSGSGKSSVVLAGLIPVLGLASQSQVAYLTPSNNPVEQLYASLSATSEQRLVVVDQFEELFTLCNDKNSRVEFINRLLKLIQTQKVVITMRADFWGECAPYVQLKELMEAQQLLIAPMNSQELKQAMERQAEQVGLRFAEGLSDSILDDVETEPGAMPLLQHALQELWKRRHGRWLLWEEYRAIGGVKQAITRTADAVYDNLEPDEKNLVRNIFVRLTQLDENAIHQEQQRDTRRRVVSEELVPAGANLESLKKLIAYLADQRLVVTSFDAVTQQEEVEVAHEALIKYWNQLQNWLTEDRKNLLLRQRIREQAVEWQQAKAKLPDNKRSGKHSNDFLVLKGGYLEEAKDLSSAQPQFFNARELLYINQCEKLQKKEVNQLRALVGGLVIFLIFSIGAGGIAFFMFKDAQKRQKSAEILARINSAEASFATNPGIEALIEGLKAGRELQQMKEVDSDTKMQVVLGLQQLVYGIRERNRLEGHQDQVRSVDLSPDGQLIASASRDNTIIIWSADGRQLHTLKGHRYRVNSVSFSPDSKILASAGVDKTVRLWKRNGEFIQTLSGHSGEVNAVSFSPDGKMLVSGSSDQTIKLWNREGKLLNTLKGHGYAVNDVAFSPDNKIIASASNDSTIKLWNKEGKLIRTLRGHEGRVTSLSFGLDGKIIASASDQGLIKLWSLDGKLLDNFQGGRNVAFGYAQENDLLAATGKDGIIRVWKVATYNSPSGIALAVNKDLISTLKGHTGSVIDVDFSQGNQKMGIVSGGDDKTIRFWSSPLKLIKSDQRFDDIGFGKSNDEIFMISEYSVSFSNLNQGGKWFVKNFESGSEELLNDIKKLNIKSFAGIDGIIFVRDFKLPLLFHQTIKFGVETFNSIVLSPDENLIASGSPNYTVKIWSKEGNLIKILGNHNAAVHDVSWSADNQVIASASADRSIKLWNTKGELLHTMNGHSNIVKSVTFHPSQPILASASVDKTIKLWKTDGQFLKSLEGHTAGVNDVNFNPDGNVLISASDDATVVFWSFDLDRLQEQGCNWLRDYFNSHEKQKDNYQDYCPILREDRRATSMDK